MSEVPQYAFGAIAGGTVTACIQWIRDRRKVPAEVDNIIANGAATNVQSALAVAAAEAARADRAESENAILRNRLEAALSRVDFLQAALDAVRDELNDIKNYA